MRKAASLLKGLCNISKTEPKNVLTITFLVEKKKCKLKHVINWLNLFVDL